MSKLYEEKYLEKVNGMSDLPFLFELLKIHRAFVAHVIDLMRRGQTPNYLFKSIAGSIADSKGMSCICGKIYVPDRYSDRLLEVLNRHQEKFKLFNNDKDQAKPRG